MNKLHHFSPFITFTLLLFLASCAPKDKRPPYPMPTQIKEHHGEHSLRDTWFELLHRAAQGTDWTQIEYNNRLQRHLDKQTAIHFREDCGVEMFAAGELHGRWQERGSGNQAGSVFDTEYDPQANEIWIISAGGTLWRGPRNGQQWQVVNQDLRFDPGLLRFIPNGNGRRLLAFAGRIPHYSDDDGQSWVPATGIRYNDRWGNFYNPILLDNEEHTLYVFAKPSYWDNVGLYKSSDKGQRFQLIKTFNTYDFQRLRLCKPHHSNELLLLEKLENGQARLSRIDVLSNDITLITNSLFSIDNAPANLIGWSGNGLTRLYAYSQQGGFPQLYQSDNYGQTWAHRGSLPATPWEVGLYVLPSNPNTLLLGEVECFKSLNGGLVWEKVNNWWDYYDDVIGKLHADMMHFAEFTNAAGAPFLLVSHHGGLTISTDVLRTQRNISLWGLNTSQYYSVRTDPNDPAYVYGGSQDQGFQLSRDFFQPGVAAFDQIISGDYGHLVFSNNNRSLWMVYPDGWVTHYASAQSGRLTASYDLVSEDKSVWLPPLMSSPFQNEDVVYMAGGNINGGGGSHLIRLEARNGQIMPTQLPFNFKSQSAGGALSAMAVSPLNANKWYAATTNGRFFHSNDAGQTWTQTIQFIPEGHYLYGQKILASNTTPNVVYLAGSGYSNPPVYRSINGGANFQPMSQGLPSTLVFDLVANADESMIFAATEAGPYVYVRARGRWYSLSGNCTPSQTYWSVEYIEWLNLVRFGTYGRGIWDFQIEDLVPTDAPSPTSEMLQVFPNPSNGQFQLQWSSGSAASLQIKVFDAQGRTVHQSAHREQPPITLNVSHLPKGVYFLTLRQGEQQYATRLVLK